MVMIDPVLFQSDWFVNLDVSDRYMYLYLLMTSDNKIGTIEWNERMINFCANTPKHYTKDDVIRIYGGRIRQVPNFNNTLIIVDYLRFQWLKNGGNLDERNPLHKSILKSLARYDLTVDKLNDMAKHKIEIIPEEPKVEIVQDCIADIDVSVSEKDMDEMFNAFWNTYPGPRKIDKKKVRAKFEKVLGKNPDKAVSMFNRIMNGLSKWMETDTWTKNDGAFVCAPLVWLNNERWDAEVKKGNGNVHTKSSANANYQSTSASGIF